MAAPTARQPAAAAVVLEWGRVGEQYELMVEPEGWAVDEGAAVGQAKVRATSPAGFGGFRVEVKVQGWPRVVAMFMYQQLMVTRFAAPLRTTTVRSERKLDHCLTL
jgi:hypothetical protein